MTLGPTLRDPVLRVSVQLAPGAPPFAIADSLTPALLGKRGSYEVLDATAGVTMHSLPSPNTSNATVDGLSEETANRIVASVEQAENIAISTGAIMQAGLLIIEAGYRETYGEICRHQILQADRDPISGSVNITAIDGRVEWTERFPKGETLPSGVPLALVAEIMQTVQQPGLVSDADFKAAFAEALPEYQAKTANTAGAARFGLLLEQPIGTEINDLNEALGLETFFLNNRPITLLKGRSSFDSRVELSTRKGLIHARRLKNGDVQAECLLIHQLAPGRPVLLQHPDGTPRLGGFFFVTAVTFSASARNGEHSVVVTLTPEPLVT